MLLTVGVEGWVGLEDLDGWRKGGRGLEVWR